jgi:phospholipase/carboxylesterase
MFSMTSACDSANLPFHLVRQPASSAGKAPVVIMLHGFGSNEADLFDLADQIPNNYLVLSLRAPIEMGKGSYAWYKIDYSTGKLVFDIKEEEKSRAMIIDFIEQVKQHYPVDEKEIYLFGFSQGAIMSYSIALTRPDLVHGIAVMSGRLMDEVKTTVATQDQLKDLKVFISHGTLDNRLPLQGAKDANAFLSSLEIHADYHEYSAGHEINSFMMQDFLNWLNKK